VSEIATLQRAGGADAVSEYPDFLMTEQFFDRDNEVDFLQDCLVSCGDRKGGRVVIIHGATAMGKTALLRRCAEQAAQAGARFLMATAASGEQALPFGVAHQLFRHAVSLFPAAGGLVAMLDRAALGVGVIGSREAGGVDAASLHVLDRLCVGLLELAERESLVIAVDDMQHADGASLEFLLYLTRRIRLSRALLILTHNGSADPQFQADLLSQPHCARIAISPLSLGGAERMFAESLGAAGAARLSGASHAITGGNPLLLRALVEDQHPASESDLSRFPDAPVAGQAYAEAVLRCLYRSAPEALAVAQGIAILGESVSRARIGSLMGLRSGVIDQADRALTEVGLLESGRFRHEAAREAALTSLPADRRGALHRRAAQQSFSAGANAVSVARQLVLAGNPSEMWEYDILGEAAETALRDGDPDFAIACLQNILEAGDGPLERVGYRVLLAKAKWRINPLAAGRLLCGNVDRGIVDVIRSGQLAGRMAVEAVIQLLWSGRLAEAARALDHMSSRNDNTSLSTAVELNRAEGWLMYAHPPLSSRIPSLPKSAGLMNLRAGDPYPRSTVVLAAVLRNDDRIKVGDSGPGEIDAEPVEAAAQILRHSRLNDDEMEATLAALLASSYADHLEMALSWSGTLLDQASAAHLAPTWYAMLTWIGARISLQAGDLERARALALDGLARMPLENWGIAAAGPLAVLVQANTTMGNLREAARYLSQPTPGATLESMFGLDYLHARGRYDLATNRPAEALTSFQACGDLMMKWEMDSPAIVPWRSDTARALIMLGEQEKAKELAKTQISILKNGNPRTRGISFRVCGLASEPPERQHLLSQAVDLLQNSGDSVELAYALTDLSHAHNSLGQVGRARPLIQRARRLAEKCHIRPLFPLLWPAAASGAEAAPDGDELGSGLSDAEHRVAALAAQGDTNREIAAKLFITVSTVEQHLTQIYRKLGIGRRADLPVSFRISPCWPTAGQE